MKAGESSKDDLLDILLDSNYKAIKHGNKNSGLTIDEVNDECKLFYFVGQETTGILLVWTMILLAQHTNWQERARKEVSQPPAVGLGRMTHEQTKLGDMTLPARTFLRLQNMLMHHDLDIWGDDVSEFKPERFSELKVSRR
ncbi:unnamed protein product [Lactuca saligna]|uniref:11-oxo-beta-amyrin 30-oxidase n=1 Tax=Lactuca saligna TaxID=75948 RepID=A0AA35US47_LACSI|nr:unnamed protein product [Lactuca saligna]